MPVLGKVEITTPMYTIVIIKPELSFLVLTKAVLDTDYQEVKARGRGGAHSHSDRALYIDIQLPR